jgi:hypothetical protein
MAVRAADVQSPPQFEHDPFATDRRLWPALSSAHRKWLGIALATALVAVGWSQRERELIDPESGVGYFLGIVSVCCMLILLLYPLRKRFRILKFIGPLPKWFRNHMVLGVSAPIAALYHCNFQLGSLNSRIALFSALLVAGSGLVGRLIYSKIHHGLYGRKANLKELLARVRLTVPGEGILGTFVPELTKRIATFDRQVLVPPKGLMDCFKMPLVLAVQTRLQYFRLARFTRQSLVFHASQSKAIAAHQRQFETVIRRYIRTHLRHVRRVAEFTAYDRLFALWHKVHFPFFVALLISVVIHVIAVHLYRT